MYAYRRVAGYLFKAHGFDWTSDRQGGKPIDWNEVPLPTTPTFFQSSVFSRNKPVVDITQARLALGDLLEKRAAAQPDDEFSFARRVAKKSLS